MSGTPSGDRSAAVRSLVNGVLGRSSHVRSLGAPVDPAALDEGIRHARELAGVDELTTQQRFGGAKRFVMRVSKLFLTRQAAYNRQVADSLEALSRQAALHATQLEQRVASLSATLVELELRFDDAADVGRRQAEQLTAKLEIELAETRDSISTLASRLAVVAADAGIATSIADDRRYADFEDEYRGSEAGIEQLLEPYLHDVWARHEVGGPVLDIGCGRGEWLQLLRKRGMAAMGVDTSQEIVDRCVERGLEVVLGDGIAHLATVPEGSLLAITSFHVLEHIPVGDHATFFANALRALRPGGVLILETPNPTNLIVGAAAFYRDPSHLRPVHPDYMRFLASDAGFTEVEIRFLHPRPEFEQLDVAADDRLAQETSWALFGPQDYALIGVRPVAAAEAG